MNKNYKDLVSEEYIEPKTDGYKITVECDANDGDCISDEIEVQDLFSDELFFLVLCYLSTDKAWKKRGDYCFGKHVEEDKYFDWLYDYCVENNLLLWAGMCDYRCHSIEYINITHYRQGLEYTVNLPSINKIFESLEEMKTYMTNLYNHV